MSELRHIHWVAAKHVLRYICVTIGYGLRYTSSRGVRLFDYIDSDWGSSAVYQKSTSGDLFQHGFNHDFQV